jgi:hypothetical protein
VEYKYQLRYCKVVKVILTKNTTLQRIEQLNSIECNYIRN